MSLRIEQLSVAFSGKRVLSGLNLSLPAGGLNFLLGVSGCGKTTLLRAINRLNECLPECVTEGRVMLRLCGAWVDAYAPALPVETLRRRVGMVFQTPNVLPLSIARNITLPLSIVGRAPDDEIAGRVEAALREAHLWNEVCDRLHVPAQSLSGGQQQRLCLARALALEPEILLLDEPTASLDVRAARQIEDLLERLKTRYTLLIVSHSIHQTTRLAERVFVLRNGSKIEPLPAGHCRDQAALLATLEEAG